MKAIKYVMIINLVVIVALAVRWNANAQQAMDNTIEPENVSFGPKKVFPTIGNIDRICDRALSPG